MIENNGLKMILFIILSIPVYACSTEHSSGTNQKPSATATDKQIFILFFEDQMDTLTAFKSDEPECFVTWKSDTIAREFTYEKSVNFISSLGALGYANVFIMQIYEGDGCPVNYKLLQIKNDSSYFLSVPFGNCEEVSFITSNWPELEFQFSASTEPLRKQETYVFNYEQSTLKEYSK